MSVEMSLLAEHFVTNWTRGWLVNLYVEMNLQKIANYYVCQIHLFQVCSKALQCLVGSAP